MRIIPRSEWRAKPPRSRSALPWPDVTTLVLHYTSMLSDQSGDQAGRVRGVQRYHQDTQGWSDIAYSFLVSDDGRIWTGRGWGIRTAATGPANGFSLAFCFLGGDRDGRDDVTDQGRASFSWLIQEAERRKGRSLAVEPHSRYMSTSCPGDELRRYIASQAWRDDDATPILGPPLRDGVGKMERWAKRHDATKLFVALAAKYKKIAPARGKVRPEVAYAQAAHETGFGRFGGVIDATYRNPCGLKKRGGGSNTDPGAHQRFPSWNEGIMAHCDHLAAYAGANGYPRTDTPDPRQHLVTAGSAKTVEALGGKWAPSPTYGDRVAKFVHGIERTA